MGAKNIKTEGTGMWWIIVIILVFFVIFSAMTIKLRKVLSIMILVVLILIQ